MEIKIFENPMFGQIRTAGTSDEPLFCLVDVARALEYSNPAKAVIDHCKGVTILETPTQNQYGATVMQKIKYGKESEVYRLVMKAKTPNAEAFQDWVCGEVLPSIRKYGTFMVNEMVERTLNDPDYLIKVARKIKAEREARELAERDAAQKQKQLELQAPKVDFYDRVTKSDSMFDMNEVSKVLKYDKIGRNNLFKILREKGILNADNQPYQKFVAQGYFKLVEDSKIIKGRECVFPQTVVFQKGVDFINRILKEYESENKDKSNQLNLF